MVSNSAYGFKFSVEFKDDPDVYVYPKLRYVGIELWQVIISTIFLCPVLLLSSYAYQFLTIWYIICQVKSGTMFNNVLVCDDPEYAKNLAEETWGKHKDVCSYFPSNVELYYGFVSVIDLEQNY